MTYLVCVVSKTEQRCGTLGDQFTATPENTIQLSAMKGGFAVPVFPVPPLSTALQEQLGLRLERSRGAVEMLVIDSVERPMPD